MSKLPSELPDLDPLDEQLVAYLDGELEPEAKQQVEDLLGANETARLRLGQLAASWDLFDQLPRATVDDLFTRTTVQMVAVAAEDELAEVNAGAPARRRRHWIEGIAATAAAAAIGFVVVAVGMPSENRELLRDLPVVQDLELYKAAGNLAVVKEFRKDRLFLDDGSSAPASGAPSGSAATPDAHTGSAVNLPPIPAMVDDRRAWLASLGPAEKTELRKNFERFVSLSSGEQDSLREFDHQLRTASDGDELHRIMKHYYDWRWTILPLDRAQLDSETTPQKRADLVKQRKIDQEQSVLNRLQSGRVTAKDRTLDDVIVLKWMRDFVQAHRAEVQAMVPEEPRTEGAKTEGRARPPRLPALIAVAYDNWWSPWATRPEPVTAEDLHNLVEQLSPERQEEFAVAGDMSEQITLLDKWVRRAVRAQVPPAGARGGGRGGLTLDNLAQFEESELTSDQRQELAKLNGPKRFRRLMEIFVQNGGGGGRGPGGGQRGGGQRGGGFPRPSGDGPPPGGLPVPPPGGPERTPAGGPAGPSGPPPER